MVLPDDPLAAAALLALAAGVAYVTFSRRTPKALGFSALTLGAFAVQTVDAFWFGGGYGRELAFVTLPFLAGEWWRAFSYMFVHADPLHLFGNLFFLATAGPALEDRLGGHRWVALYLGGGALVVLSHMLFHFEDGVAAVGASGAIFAVLGALAVAAPNLRIPIPLLLIIWMPAWVAVLLFVGMNVAYAFGGPLGVAWYGHLAGAAVGVFAGAALLVRRRRTHVRRAKLTAEALAPFAATPRARQTLERLRAIRGETPDDAAYAEAWIERFLKEATCPVCAAVGLERDGETLRCRAQAHAVPVAKA